MGETTRQGWGGAFVLLPGNSLLLSICCNLPSPSPQAPPVRLLPAAFPPLIHLELKSEQMQSCLTPSQTNMS